MSNAYQKVVFRRKMAYLGTMLGLLVVTLFVRGTLRGSDLPSPWSIQGRADQLELNELSQGEAELTGSTVRLLLTGSRGLAVCVLWNAAIDKQREQEWNELDLLVKSITKLQPHFVSPWLFQSWNITYNVSVEMDRLNDMYYYIARGISLLAEGEAMNRGSPDIRYNVGFYYQNKFGVSDKVTTLRCLLQLSCIPWEDRDPDRFEERDPEKIKQSGEIRLDTLRSFCEKYPQLIRRLKDTPIRRDGKEIADLYLCPTPKDLVRFLRENAKVPSRYQGQTRELADRLVQFPVLAPKDRAVLSTELAWDEVLPDHQQEGFQIARGWFAYANTVLPPPPADKLPEGIPEDFDRNKYRLPKRPALIIFRQGPPRAQTYVAERLLKEGWFFPEPWTLDDDELSQQRWFPEKFQVTSPGNAQAAWDDAYKRWSDHGENYGLLISPERMRVLEERAKRYVLRRGLPPGSNTQPLTAEEADDPEKRADHKAHQALTTYRQNQYMTQYDNFYVEAATERKTEMVRVRQQLFLAKRLEVSNPFKALTAMGNAFTTWKAVLSVRNCTNDFSTGEFGNRCTEYREIPRVMDEMYEFNIRYLRLRRDIEGDGPRRAVLHLSDVLSLSTNASATTWATKPSVLYKLVPAFQNLEGLPIPGPFDGVDGNGVLWVPDNVKAAIRDKMGFARAASSGNAPKGTEPAPKD